MPHTHVLSVVIIDETTGFMTVKLGWPNDEIWRVKGEETVAIETAWIALRQHEGLGDTALDIDMTEIGSCEEAVVTTGTEHKPARVGAPVVERLRIVRVSLSHGAALARSEVKQIEVSLVVPDAELSVVGECVAKETTVVGRTREG